MECMSFNQLFIIPQNLLAGATAASNSANGVVNDQGDASASPVSDVAAAAATCDPSNAGWEPVINLILALGMIVMILVSVLSAYMEAMLYLKSHQSPSSNSCKSSSVSANRANNNNNNNNNSNNNNNNNNNNSNNNSGITASISASSFSHQQQQQQQNSNSVSRFNALSSNGNKAPGSHLQNGNNSNKNNKYNASNVNSTNTSNTGGNKSKRKNSSTINNERTTTNNSKSIGSTASDKRSSNICAPMFQNLTNVIASPPPPLPAFDSEEFGPSSVGSREDEFKKFRGKKAAKKSKKGKKESQTNSIAEADNSTPLEQLTVLLNHQPETTTTTATCSSSSSSSASLSSANSLVSSTKSSASTSSSINSSAPSTTPSSTSSSPPLSASSYGEYSLLGPGVTFELPCLRVRSAQT